MLDKLPTSKDLYDREMAQRDTLRSAVGQPIALLSIVATLLGTMFQKYQMQYSAETVLFGATFVFACYSGARAAISVVRAYHGHNYKGMRSALEIRKTHLALVAWYVGQAKPAADAECDLLDQLDEQYSIAADHNAQVNERRSEFLYLANRYIIFAGVGAALAFVPFLWNQLTTEPRSSVQIVDFAAPVYREYRQNGRPETPAEAAGSPAPTKAPASAAKGPSRGVDSAGSSRASKAK